jgi:hypothetical protein
MLTEKQTIENFKEEVKKIKAEYVAGLALHNWKYVDKFLQMDDMHTYFITNSFISTRIHFDESLQIIIIDRINVRDIDTLREMAKSL